MSNCNNCNTRFKFGDVLKGFNPASVKCSGCSERIKSSYITLVIALVLFFVLMGAFWSLPLVSGAQGGALKLIGVCVIALVFEYGYFFLLSKGTIKSNLSINEAQT